METEVTYRISKWKRKQKKYNKTRLATKTINKKRNDKKNNKKSLKILNQRYCNVALKNIKYNNDNYIDDIDNTTIECKCHLCSQPLLLKDLPMAFNATKPFVCTFCAIKGNESRYDYTITYGDCIVCNKNCHYKQLFAIDCKICEESLSKYFNKSPCIICIGCADVIDVCTIKKSQFCKLYHRIIVPGFRYNPAHINEIPIIRTDIINDPMKWKFKSDFCGYKTDNNYDWHLYSICNETYKIIYKENGTLCCGKGCNNFDNTKYCYYHSACNICKASLYDNIKYDVDYKYCQSCGNVYCYSGRECGKCGTYTHCKNCCMNKEKTNLVSLIKHIIDENVLYDDIISVIFNYAFKYALMCANYKKCKNVIISGSSVLRWVSKGLLPWFYYIDTEHVNQNVIYNCSYINGRYVRAFCNECYCYTQRCKLCDYYYNIRDIDENCWNHPQYKCDECNKLLYCDEKKNRWCNICKMCENARIARNSNLSPTAPVFVPTFRPIATLQQNWPILLHQQNVLNQQLIQLQNNIMMNHAHNPFGAQIYNYNIYFGGNNNYCINSVPFQQF